MINDHLSRISRRRFLQLCGGATVAGLAGSRLAAAAGGSHRGARNERPNLVFVVTDALRSDHVTANGYGRDTTAHLDQWVANEGVTFRQATSSAAWTFPATAAMMTGRLPWRLGANWNNQLLPVEAVTLAETLRAAGYTSAGFVSAPFSRAKHGLNQGFDIYDDSLGNLPGNANGQAAQLNALAQTWLAAWDGGRPLFLFLYYFDIHTWYRPPTPYDTRYDPSYAGILTPEIYMNGEPVVGGSIDPTSRDIEHLTALYDGETAYWDTMLGQMLAFLKDRGILDNAVIVVTADHGDLFGEHGLWTHGNCLYEEVLRVPLLMRYSGVAPRGLAVQTPVQNIDIMPTLLDWAGISSPAGMDGVSLRTLAEGQAAVPHDVFSEIDGVTDPLHWAYWLAPRDSLRSVRRGDTKYIHHIGREPADELYQLNASSIHERENVLAAQPGMAQELLAALQQRFSLYRTALPVTMAGR